MKQKLNFLIQPKTIAVVGTSDKQGKVGFSVMKNLISSGFPDNGDLFPINPRLDTIMGYKALSLCLMSRKRLILL
jgi:acyl-CoA synthetase (NDP forming)